MVQVHGEGCLVTLRHTREDLTVDNQYINEKRISNLLTLHYDFQKKP